jgi:hypothetical protein
MSNRGAGCLLSLVVLGPNADALRRAVRIGARWLWNTTNARSATANQKSTTQATDPTGLA